MAHGGAAAGQGAEAAGISREPVSVLFNTSSIAKRDVWEIDLVRILDLLIGILERSGRKDLRVAGMAALSSSLIYRMKVDSIFALQRAAAEERAAPARAGGDIEVIDIPYRHESTYPVTLDELLGMLEGLIGSLANPRGRRARARLDPVEAPDLREHLVQFEDAVGRYGDMVVGRLAAAGRGLLGEIAAGLDPLDAIRCFFAVLVLARDGVVEAEQAGDDIMLVLTGEGRA